MSEERGNSFSCAPPSKWWLPQAVQNALDQTTTFWELIGE